MLNKNPENKADFQVNHKEILDNDLEQVSGGWNPYLSKDHYEICPFCRQYINQTLGEHERACTVKPWHGYSIC